MQASVHMATGVQYEPNGDTLRVFSSAPPQAADAMRDVLLAMDANGHLVAVLFQDQPPRPAVGLGPPNAVAAWKQARVLAMVNGTILITMGAKRVRGDERNPYVKWAVYPNEPA
ncbi:MAG: hypothetical protein U0441_01810 [Polyangiaceae bacterium]